MGILGYLATIKEKIKETIDLLEDKSQIKNYEDYCFHLGRLKAFKDCLELWKDNTD